MPLDFDKIVLEMRTKVQQKQSPTPTPTTDLLIELGETLLQTPDNNLMALGKTPETALFSQENPFSQFQHEGSCKPVLPDS